jgi:hypothetical protein
MAGYWHIDIPFHHYGVHDFGVNPNLWFGQFIHIVRFLRQANVHQCVAVHQQQSKEETVARLIVVVDVVCGSWLYVVQDASH